MRHGLLTTFAITVCAAALACAEPGQTLEPQADVPTPDTVADATGDDGLAVGETDAVGSSDAAATDAPFELPSQADVVVSVPDTYIPPKPMAGVCTTDDECLDGWCNTSYTGGYCSLKCTAHSDCPDEAKCYAQPGGGEKMCWKACSYPSDCRPDQFCGSSGGICTPKCTPGSCGSGYECNQGTGKCVPVGSVSCVPTTEVCDEADNDCDGVVDEGCGPGLESHPNYIVTDLGAVSAGGDGLSQVIEFSISSGAKGFQVILLSGDDSEEYLALFELKNPSGLSIVSGLNYYEHINRSHPGLDVATTHVPISPEVPMESGKYSMSIYRSGAVGKVWVYVVQSIRANVSQSTVDLNFWFVGTPINAVTANTNSKFQSLLGKFAQLLAEHGVTIKNLNFYDVTGTDAQKFSIIDSSSPGGGGIDEHGELLRLSSSLPASNTGLNFFFVQGFTESAVLGKAGGIPGPVIHGTSDSGVVVSLADYYSLPSNYGIPLTAHSMVHEMGHQLGLSHTSEQQQGPDGWIHDPIADSPECENDSNKNGIVEAGECIGSGQNNVMFWSAHFSNTLTPGQLFVVHRSPYLAEP